MHETLKALDYVCEFAGDSSNGESSRFWGFFNFACCMSCAKADALEFVNEYNQTAEDEGSLDRITAYFGCHMQDVELFTEEEGLYLCWEGDAAKIVKLLRSYRLDASWNGQDNTRIFVAGKLLPEEETLPDDEGQF